MTTPKDIDARVAALMEQNFELNLGNYDSVDVERLQAWALDAHDLIAALRTELQRPAQEVVAGTDHLRWAKAALHLVGNKLRAIGLPNDGTAMVNLDAAEKSIDAALLANTALVGGEAISPMDVREKVLLLVTAAKTACLSSAPSGIHIHGEEGRLLAAPTQRNLLAAAVAAETEIVRYVADFYAHPPAPVRAVEVKDIVIACKAAHLTVTQESVKDMRAALESFAASRHVPVALGAVPGKLPRHKFWGAGEADCPQDLKAGNGELHTMRCKVCGDGWRKSVDVCFAAAPVATAEAVPATPAQGDAARLDWLDAMNARKNLKNGTVYGWRFEENHNRIALSDHWYPRLSIREAIDAAIAANQAVKGAV